MTEVCKVRNDTLIVEFRTCANSLSRIPFRTLESVVVDSKIKYILEIHESVGSLTVVDCGRIVFSFEPYKSAGPEGVFPADIIQYKNVQVLYEYRL
uniref:Uncharacterized protein n=1 Tax=Megaselia scalaris TaxID=36166 RepID=T1GLR3_MEGSC